MKMIILEMKNQLMKIKIKLKKIIMEKMNLAIEKKEVKQHIINQNKNKKKIKEILEGLNLKRIMKITIK